jgi:heme-degrading monooxygenase HmoA
MYARVTTLEAQPGKAEEIIRIYRDTVVPAAKELQGFKGAWLLTDLNGNRGISITLWETDADLKASETSGFYQEQVGKFLDLAAAPPIREAYEISVLV